MTRIAILGWGSLVWDPDSLGIEDFPPASEAWRLEGPELPLEFSRISGRNRLTLVIDSDNGRYLPTRVATSTFSDIDAAKENLRRREETVERFIGYVDGRTDEDYTYFEDRSAIESVRDWLAGTDYDAVIWTDLYSNFEKKRDDPFSVKAALEYLAELEEDRDPISAAEYIVNAPDEIRTPSRPHLEAWAEDILAERSPAHQ